MSAESPSPDDSATPERSYCRARSFFQEFAVASFGIAIEFRLGKCVPIAVRRMKPFIRECVQAVATQCQYDAHETEELLECLLEIRRRPDAVCVLTSEDASAAGISDRNSIILLEVEDNCPLTQNALLNYTNVGMMVDDTALGEEWALVVILLDRYGHPRALDLNIARLAITKLRIPRGSERSPSSWESGFWPDLIYPETGTSLINPNFPVRKPSSSARRPA